MKLILILRSEDKQTADSPCEEIRISGEIENEAKAYKAFPSQKCKAFRSRNISFHPQNVCSVPKAFRSILEAFRFVQTVQRSCGVVVPLRICTLPIVQTIFFKVSASVYLNNGC